jgi:hypothetical protein
MHEYLVDIKLIATLRLKASSPEELSEMLDELFEGAEVTFGFLDEPITGSVAMQDNILSGDPDFEIVEIDGEAT